jgi:chitin-binding protein
VKNGYLAAIACSFAFLPVGAMAHGSMETPISRVYRCFLEGPEAPKTEPCQAVVDVGGTQPLYDWMEVNQSQANGRHGAVVPDGALCAGGREKYVGLDLPRRDWKKTRIAPDADGKYTFAFYATTPHATKYFRFYITKDGWNRNQSLSWSDVEKFAKSKPKKTVDNRYLMTVSLPPDKTGPHVIYVIWQRSDSQEAFYSCSDVRIVAPTSAATAEMASSWSEVGRAIAYNPLEAGSRVTFRVFDENGGDAEGHVVVIGPGETEPDAWPLALADKVNAKSDVFRIGVLDDGGMVTPIADATENLVYRSNEYVGFSYQIDIDTP